MSPIRSHSLDHHHGAESSHRFEAAGCNDKTRSLLEDVLPSALAVGVQGLQGIGATTAKQKVKPGPASTALGIAGAAAREVLPIASRWAGIATGALGAFDLIATWGRSNPVRGAASGSAIGATVGTCFSPGAGTAVGAAVGTIFGGLLGCIKTGKHRDQITRDSVRTLLVERGVLASDYSIRLADGTRFDVGRDGGPKKDLGGLRPYEVDFRNPLAKYAVSWMNPVIALLSQGNQKIQSDFVGYFANAAMSNAKDITDLKANIDAILEQFGIDDTTLADAIGRATSSGIIAQHDAQAYLNGMQERLSLEPNSDEFPAGNSTE